MPSKKPTRLLCHLSHNLGCEHFMLWCMRRRLCVIIVSYEQQLHTNYSELEENFCQHVSSYAFFSLCLSLSFLFHVWVHSFNTTLKPIFELDLSKNIDNDINSLQFDLLSHEPSTKMEMKHFAQNSMPISELIQFNGLFHSILNMIFLQKTL